jgi:tetratricopeptide (TPR) repeat protein
MSVNDKNPMMTTNQGNHTSYVFNYLGLTEAKLKSYTTAKSYFDSAIRLDSKEPDYFVNRGLVKENLSDSTAVLDYEKALQLNPGHTLAQHNLSALKAKKQQTVSPEDRLSKTIEADSTMLYPYLERAQQRYESKYYEGAMDDYTMALEIDSSNVEIWLARGLTREKMKDLKGAFSDYTRAINLKENYAKAWLNRGNVLLKLERYNDAIEDYNVALLYYPDYALGYYNRAMAKMKLKNGEEACTDLRQAETLGMKVDSKVKAKICNH